MINFKNLFGAKTFSNAAPGFPYASAGAVQYDDVTKHFDHPAIGVSIASLDYPWTPETWNKLQNLPSAASIASIKTPQRL